MMRSLNRWLHHDLAGGILLIGAAFLALVAANTPFVSTYYDLLLDTPVEVQIGAFEIHKPLLLWVNDGLMALFFLLVGLELKREFLEGELSDWGNVVLPAVGALGGMIAPALIYIWLNWGDFVAKQGWAIPVATDIAFALGVLTLLGKRVPLSVKVFLTSLAIFDDIGAIVVIAIFYTTKISMVALVTAGVCICVLVMMKRAKVVAIGPYFVIGIVMWAALLKSGVHATLSGVILAMFIPMNDPHRPGHSPLRNLENDLHSMVLLGIVPIFAFCNAGVNLVGMTVDQITHSVPVGIASGLFFGKIIGVFGFVMIPVALGLIALPKGFNKTVLLGVASLCGIGFTMSLFIGSLAFQHTGVNQFDERLGILAGSLISGLVGYFVLRWGLDRQATTSTAAPAS